MWCVEYARSTDHEDETLDRLALQELVEHIQVLTCSGADGTVEDLVAKDLVCMGSTG